MGVGSLVFMLPHFTAEPPSGSVMVNSTSDNICKTVSVREQDMGLGRFSGIQPINQNFVTISFSFPFFNTITEN